jgi:hypothetical protein
MGRVRAVPCLCELYPGICLTTEEKPPTCLGVCYTIFKEIIELLTQKLYAFF